MLLLVGSVRAFAGDETPLYAKNLLIRDETGAYKVCGHGKIESLELTEDPVMGTVLSVRMQYMDLLDEVYWNVYYDDRIPGRNPDSKAAARISIYQMEEGESFFEDKYMALRNAFALNVPVQLGVDWLSAGACSKAHDIRIRVCGQQGSCRK